VKIVVAGGTGLIGTPLVAALAATGHEVRLLSRSERTASTDLPGSILPCVWDGVSVPESVMEGADAVVNLAGESIGGGRWTRRKKTRIIGSRVGATRAIVEAIAAAKSRPAVLLNGSAVGYYGEVPSGEVLENSPRGAGFLSETVEQWETEAVKARALGLRVVVMRMGVVLAPAGGILSRLTLPFRLFVGGPVGSGAQWISWMHLDDAIRAIYHCLEQGGLDGPVNLCAPDARTMKEFCDTMGRVMRRPSWFRVPAWFIRVLFGEMADIVLQGQRVIPQRLQESNFIFRFPRLLSALIDLLVR
jgi:uncharacterized protein